MAYLLALEVDPSIVRSGWGPLIVVSLLAAAMVLLYLSMRRQFRKIRIAADATADAAETATEDTAAEPESSKPATPNGSA